MLSRPNRFSLKTDRFRIESLGKTKYSSLFTIIIAPRPDGELPPRFAILASKKSFPQSVTRHRLKRYLTEIIRHNLSKFPLGIDSILIPKKNILTAPPDQILAELQKLIINS